MGMYPPNMMGMNPNNINLNGDNSQSQSSYQQQPWNDMQMQGFHPGMFQQNQNFQNGPPNQEQDN